MDFKVHLISGLPRSGSTLLSAILRQNPRFQAGMSGPLADILVNLVQVMSSHESAIFISDAQREKILKSVVGAYYCGSTGKVIFDTNRRWCGLLSLVVQLLPGSLVICCVRNPAWIIDSVERLVQRNPLLVPKMFGHEVIDVYRRAEYLTTKGFLAPAANGLKQAWYGDNAGRLMAIRYESLAQRPAEVIRSLYEHLDEPLFEHDFENVERSEERRVGTERRS